MIIFGVHPLDELSKTTGFYESDRIYIALKKPRIRIQKIIHKTKKSGAKIIPTSLKNLSILANSENHQGIVLKRIENYSFKTLIMQDIIEQNHGIYVLIDRLNDPQNLGSIIRSMAAFGSKGLILNKKKTPPIGQAVWKVSSGAISRIPILWANGILSFLKRLGDLESQKSYVLIGVDSKGEALSGPRIEKINFQKQKVFLLLGEEEKGISEHLTPELNFRLKIPQSLDIDSLNVGVAAGIFLYRLSSWFE